MSALMAKRAQKAGCAHSPRDPAPRIDSAVLLGGGRKLLIEHDGEVYTLQLTRQNKLLLTK